jgi:hypothetical protein
MTCSLDLAIQILTVIHDTVGLHTYDQISALPQGLVDACPTDTAADVLAAVKTAYLLIFSQPL